jgi:hypothetical protein
MSGKTKQLTRAAITLVVALLARKAFQDRKFRRRASDLGQSARKQVQSAGKVMGDNLGRFARAAGKQAPVLGREAVKQFKRLAKSPIG